ncbi:MAG: PAS domain-containing protein, partial [Gammaproteobacteria bacterium]|nr:PAS domain-containing protein [Gammaproteobacteria bacterium]
MKINKHSLLLIIILSVIVFIVMGLTLSTLYNAAFEQQRAQLTAITQSQARLIESVARFDELFSKNDVEGGAAIATLNQIKDAHLNNQGFGKSGEFLFGKKENNKIIFLIPRRFKGILEAEGQNGLLDVGGTYAEPIQLALAGKSGNVIARDYRGVLVLAAYAPVNILNHGYGVVAKIDMQEIREPFIRVGLISVLVAVILIFIGAVLFLRITNPIIKRMEGSAKRLNEAQRLAKVGSWELNLLNGKLIWSDEIFHIFDIDKNKFDASYDAFLNAIHPDDREAVNKAYTDSLTDRKPYEIVHRLK